ncbi:hypothetical protein [Actibacterium sp. 188UL27-1]|uniref:hypothetical protein n=1 Tax=Actibacterium sp. 188UL27-1 TaxID=2786961 RepID=UPI00195BA5B3|nr:hypothetical protein [Actibacterium sp. 188UL27-1]MBM7068350.1 hypothetical protein [Actibacterium sp. 188UL27-1]
MTIDLPSAPTTQKVVQTWVVGAAIATTLIWGWMAWQGWPSWLWAVLPIYVASSLVLSLIMNAVLHRKIDTLTAMIDHSDLQDDP